MTPFKQILQTILCTSFSDDELLSMLPWNANSKKNYMRYTPPFEWGGDCFISQSLIERIADRNMRFAETLKSNRTHNVRIHTLVSKACRCIRIRMILELVDAKNASISLANFIRAEITDESLPLSPQHICKILEDSAKASKFWKLQFWTLPTPTVLGNSMHVVVQSKLYVPLQRLTILGYGSYATVDSVEDVMNNKRYARKVFRPIARRQFIMAAFQNEIETIKRLKSNSHIIAYAGSYVAGSEIGILLTPIADRNMQDFLGSVAQEGLSKDERKFLRKSLGCLMSGLSFMHRNGVRHKDIKPANILIHGTNVLFADFGLAWDFDRLDTSATTGPIGPTTRKYSAREVHESERRDTRADVYSLGCVFLEICTVLANLDLEAFEETLIGDGDESRIEKGIYEQAIYAFNTRAIETQLDRIDNNGIVGEPVNWCRCMLRDDSMERPRVEGLRDRIYDGLQGDRRSIFFCANCLLEPQTRIGEELEMGMEMSPTEEPTFSPSDSHRYPPARQYFPENESSVQFPSAPIALVPSQFSDRYY